MVPRFRKEMVCDAILEKLIDDIHWATIRKMNSLYGGYQLWHTDIYTQIMQSGRECFSNAIRPTTAIVHRMLIDVRSENARSVTDGYLNQYDHMVKESTEEIGQYFFQWALNQGFAPQSNANRFWLEVNAISGKGFKARVREKYEEKVFFYSEKLAKMVTDEITKIVDRLIALFPEE